MTARNDHTKLIVRDDKLAEAGQASARTSAVNASRANGFRRSPTSVARTPPARAKAAPPDAALEPLQQIRRADRVSAKASAAL